MAFRNNWVKALIINAIILIVILLCTNMSYETNDDYAMANRIVAGSPNVEFTDYFLCLILCKIQAWIPIMNVFVLFQVVFSYLAFVMITKLALDLDRSFWIHALFVMVIAIYSFDHYAVIQFTKTSGLLAVAGMLLIVDTIVHKRNFMYYFWALVFMYLSTMLRFEMCIFPICFAGLYLVMRLIHGRREVVSGGFLSPGRLVGYVLVLILLGGAACVHFASDGENLKSQELRDYIYYSTYRSYVVDYPIYEHFKEHPEEYAGIDITKNDFSLIDNWYFDYDGAASRDNLTAIKEVYDKSQTAERTSMQSAFKSCVSHIIKDMRKFDSSGIHIWILLGIALAALIRMKPRYWWYIIAVGAGAVAFYVLLYQMGRPAYRVTEIVDISATIFLLHAFEWQHFWHGPDPEEHRGVHGVGRVFGIAASVVMMAALCGGLWLEYNLSQDHAAQIEKRLRPAALAERIAEDQDHVYVFSTREKNNTDSYAHPLKVPDPDPNVMTFGGWGTLSPYLMDRLHSYGLSNVFRDIIDNPQVYVIEDKRGDSMEEYFNRWYADPEDGASAIRYEPVDEVDGYKIWSVVRSGEAD